MASAEWIHGQNSSHRRQSGRHLQYVLQQSSPPAAVTPSEANTSNCCHRTYSLHGKVRRSESTHHRWSATSGPPTVVLRYSAVRAAIQGRDRASLTFVRGCREQSVEINVKSVDRLPSP